MAALTARGMNVQPFKVGPDFIDPSYHTSICGRHSRNLDPFMMGEDGCRSTFFRASAGADIAVIEGVMGLYDGVDGGDLASTAHVARILQAPVILVVDAKGMSRSVHALIQGFLAFDPAITIAGIIINRIGSPRHRAMIERSGSIPVLGWIPRKEDIATKSRHLGLVMAHETGSLDEIGPLVEEYCNLDEMVSAAAKCSLPDGTFPREPIPASRARIGIALDEAFCFYYQDNFDSLRRQGAELVFFSPLKDALPAIDGLYLGGGYPELHLPPLEASLCTRDLVKAAGDELPVLGECGGLMYLTREIRAGKTYRMAGILPGSAEMTPRIQGLGYVTGTSAGSSPLLPRGSAFTGHEFHYSRVIPDADARFAANLSRGKGIRDGSEGLVSSCALGMYTHAYFTPSFAKNFVDLACTFSRS
jgi:cobyrinic acid a,c-diamide synthase